MAFHAPERHVALTRIQIARMAFVFVLAGFALARTLPDSLRIGWPLAIFGYYTDAAGTITSVTVPSPASRAGLKRGDRVDVEDFNLADRKPGLIGKTFSAYNPIRHLTIVRDGVRMSFELRGVPESMQTRIVILLREITALVTIAIAALLAIVRPNRASLGFFHFVLGGSAYPSAMTSIWLDYPWRMIVDGVNDAIVAGSIIGLAMFALGFPRDIAPRWRIPLDTCAIGVWIAAATLYVYSDLGSTYFARQAGAQEQAYWTIHTLLAIAAVIAFVVTLYQLRGAEQVREALVVGAFVIALLGELAAERYYPGLLRYWQYSALQLLPILPAIVVFYGATRHHILGIDFILNRAIVYASIMAATIGIFALAEEGFGYWFSMNVNLAYALLLIVSAAFGYFINHIREAVRALVDRMIFPGREEARAKLDELANVLPFAAHRDEIEYALTCEVQQALQLRCAVLFEMRGDRFVVAADAHWPPSAASIPGDDPTLQRTLNGGIAEFLTQRDWAPWSSDLEPASPRVAVPIKVDAGATFVAVYGLEVSGVDLDVDEVRSLEHLATGAAVGFSNLRTRELAAHLEELTALREELARLRNRYGDALG